MRLDLDRPSRLRALELLAAAERASGNASGEVAALEEAVRLESDSARLWTRLSEACGRARQFRRAEAARLRGLALAGKG
jgi:predicted Zn-dependent protease